MGAWFSRKKKEDFESSLKEIDGKIDETGDSLNKQRSNQRAMVKNLVIAFALVEIAYLAWWLMVHKGPNPLGDPMNILLEQALWFSPLVALPLLYVLKDLPRRFYVSVYPPLALALFFHRMIFE